MGLLPDWLIRQAVHIEPFTEGMKRPGVISYGLSSYGYDLRAGYNWKVFTNMWGSVVDPKHFDPKGFIDVDATQGAVLIPPNSFALTESVETVTVPRDCLALVIGKSTYARCGIVLNCTPLEPEWTGKVTLEVSNTTPLPARVYAGEGIGQVLFFTCDTRKAFYDALVPFLTAEMHDRLLKALTVSNCAVSYADKQGKYQDQKGLELPKVD